MKETTDKFPCTGCGCCCKRVNLAVQNLGSDDPKDPLYFPYGWDETGKCDKLTEDNQCSVYDNRPTLCSVEEVADLFGIDKHEFFKLNVKVCNKFMDEDGVDKKFRI